MVFQVTDIAIAFRKIASRLDETGEAECEYEKKESERSADDLHKRTPFYFSIRRIRRVPFLSDPPTWNPDRSPYQKVA